MDDIQNAVADTRAENAMFGNTAEYRVPIKVPSPEETAELCDTKKGDTGWKSVWDNALARYFFFEYIKEKRPNQGIFLQEIERMNMETRRLTALRAGTSASASASANGNANASGGGWRGSQESAAL